MCSYGGVRGRVKLCECSQSLGSVVRLADVAQVPPSDEAELAVQAQKWAGGGKAVAQEFFDLVARENGPPNSKL